MTKSDDLKVFKAETSHGGSATVASSLNAKIVTLDELRKRVDAFRRDGKTIALCHGVFDVVHLGHVRHLQAARAAGDVLIVTITSDSYVNKGPDRPVFAQHFRAEMLAALELVDFVAIHHGPSAVPVIEALRPNVYVKGSDYENASDDVTGKIRQERDMVESFGGRILFTHDITFSSSNLINRYLDIHDLELREYLAAAGNSGAYQRILDLVTRVQDYKVVLVGDTIIDEYVYVTALGKPSKENIVATLYRDRELFPGGVIAAANHVAGFCREVEVMTALGNSETHETLIRQNLRSNVTLRAIEINDRSTTKKTRFLDSNYRKLFEVYTMNDAPLESSQRLEINDLVRQQCAAADVTIVTDFGHGLIDSSTVVSLTNHARFLAINAQTNSGNQGFNLVTKYPRADFVCIDAPEARLAASDKFSDIDDVIRRGLAGRIDCDRFIITHGALGCYGYAKREASAHVPAFTKNVVDTVGAGDAFFAVTSALVAAGGAIEDVAIVGNAVGAIKVGIVGHRNFVDRPPLLKYLAALLK